MSLYERARTDVGMRAYLYLRARGVEEDTESLAGAMLEAERDVILLNFLSGNKYR